MLESGRYLNRSVREVSDWFIILQRDTYLFFIPSHLHPIAAQASPAAASLSDGLVAILYAFTIYYL